MYCSRRAATLVISDTRSFYLLMSVNREGELKLHLPAAPAVGNYNCRSMGTAVFMCLGERGKCIDDESTNIPLDIHVPSTAL